MSRGKSIIGALVLCALSLGILGAANASAAGLTAVACNEVAAGTGHFSSGLCETPQVEKGNFETVGIAAGTATPVTGESVGETKLTATILFVNTEVNCKAAHITGKVTNRETTAGAMEAEGTETVIHYTECEAGLKEKVAKGEEACVVESISGVAGNKGTIQTNELMSLTAKEHNVVITPSVAGTPFAVFRVRAESATAGKPCNLPASEITVSGTITGIANTTKHSHLTFEPATNGNEGSKLTANGGASSYHGTFVGYMENENGTPGNTVGLTTF